MKNSKICMIIIFASYNASPFSGAYIKQPEGYSKSTLEQCPSCKRLCWISEYKKK